MMGPELRSGSSSTSVVANTMDALKDFLQQMARTIELLCSRYDMAAQTLPMSAFENPDVRTSLFGGTPSVTPSTVQSTGEVHGHHNDEGKLGQVQNAFWQGLNLVEDRRLNAAIFETQEIIYGTLGPESQGNSTEEENRVELRSFLEEMKKTIHAWSVKHDSLVQGKNISTRLGSDMDVVEATTTGEGACPPSQQLDSDVTVMGELALGPDEVSLPSSKDQGVVAIPVMDLPNFGEDETCEMPQSNHDEKGDGTCFVQLKEREGGETSLPQASQGNADATSFSLQQVPKEIGGSPYAHQPPPQEVPDKQELSKEMKTAVRSSLPIIQVDPVQAQSHVDMDVEIPTRNNSQEGISATTKVNNAVKPKVEQEELKIRSPQSNSLLEVKDPPNNYDAGCAVMVQPSQRRVDIVGSPEWLPHGWVTEVKIRGSGNSAGTKDKYYFDPVSKRRFRSRKEVFCFLETGKRGRYRKKPAKKLLGMGRSSAAQTTDMCQVTVANENKTSGTASSLMVQQNTLTTSGPSNVASVTPPMGIFSNMYMPYRPGRPSEWQFYESLARFPFAVFDPFCFADYNASKSAYSRGPYTWPWYNTEGSSRPFVDKIDVSKSVEKSKDGRSETLPLPKRAKKSSKKRAT